MHSKIPSYIAVALLVFICFGCGQNTAQNTIQDDLLNYINTDLPPLVEIEEEVMYTYEKVTGDNYTDDIVLYDALTEQIIPTYRKFVEQIEDIDPKTQEVKDLHELYIAAANTQFNAFTQMVAAIEQQDTNLITNANEKLTKARKGIRDFTNKLDELTKKHNVIVEEEE